MTETTPFITPQDMARIVNAYAGEVRVKWSDEFECFVTTDGTRYCEGDIEDMAQGILKAGQEA